MSCAYDVFDIKRYFSSVLSSVETVVALVLTLFFVAEGKVHCACPILLCSSESSFFLVKRGRKAMPAVTFVKWKSLFFCKTVLIRVFNDGSRFCGYNIWSMNLVPTRMVVFFWEWSKTQDERLSRSRLNSVVHLQIPELF